MATQRERVWGAGRHSRSRRRGEWEWEWRGGVRRCSMVQRERARRGAGAEGRCAEGGARRGGVVRREQERWEWVRGAVQRVEGKEWRGGVVWAAWCGWGRLGRGMKREKKE